MDAAALPVKTTAEDWLGITEALPTVLGVGDVTEIVGNALTEVTVVEALTGTPPRTPETVSVEVVPTVEETVHEIAPNPLKPPLQPKPLVPFVVQQPAGMYALVTEREPLVASRPI